MSAVSLKVNDNGKVNKVSVKWKYTGVNGKGYEYPLKIWENLECVLAKHGIVLKRNEVSKDIDFFNFEGAESRNGRIADIHSLQIIEGLGMNEKQVTTAMARIAEEKSYNPFIDMLKENENSDISIIKEVFETIPIREEYKENVDFYSLLFVKWCIGVVKMAHNTLENAYSSQGVLILQGKQGDHKSTFFRLLLPNHKWFKGDESVDPSSRDNVMKVCGYVICELGEFDDTMKKEQAKLKQFFTSVSDEYRIPYGMVNERHPRKTSFCATVNKTGFLKDETGSRRYWVIPVSMIDRNKVEAIDKNKFWGAVYHLYKSGEVTDWLDKEETAELERLNRTFNYKDDVAITLDDKLDWDSPREEWGHYSVTTIAERLCIREKAKIKNEMQRRGIKYEQKRYGGKPVRGYTIPILPSLGDF